MHRLINILNNIDLIYITHILLFFNNDLYKLSFHNYVLVTNKWTDTTEYKVPFKFLRYI